MTLIVESILKIMKDVRSKIFENRNIGTTTCNLQQLKVFFSDLFNLFLVCKILNQFMEGLGQDTPFQLLE